MSTSHRHDLRTSHLDRQALINLVRRAEITNAESVANLISNQIEREGLFVVPGHLTTAAGVEPISPEELARAMPSALDYDMRARMADEAFVVLGPLYRRASPRSGPPRPARDHEPGVVDPGFQSADALITALIKVAPDLVAAVVRRRLTANEAKALETLADAAADAEIGP